MNHEVSENKFPIKTVVAGAMAALALGASIKYGPDLWDDTSKIGTEKSLIVAGVPGQVETWDSEREWTGKFFVNRYRLEIEQCPSDVAAAKEGKFTESYDPKVGERSPKCNFDWVKVSGDTISSTKIGDPITFKGPVGEPLRK